MTNKNGNAGPIKPRQYATASANEGLVVYQNRVPDLFFFQQASRRVFWLDWAEGAALRNRICGNVLRTVSVSVQSGFDLSPSFSVILEIHLAPRLLQEAYSWGLSPSLSRLTTCSQHTKLPLFFSQPSSRLSLSLSFTHHHHNNSTLIHHHHVHQGVCSEARSCLHGHHRLRAR